MKRRTLLAAAAAALAQPAIAQPAIAQPARILRFVPNVDLPVLDPVANTAAQVRNHAFLVFDTLYGLDAAYVPRPQMVAGHTVEDDGRLWMLTLRPALRFHDGTPVLARDAVASIRRWGAVDGFGATLLAVTDALEPRTTARSASASSAPSRSCRTRWARCRPTSAPSCRSAWPACLAPLRTDCRDVPVTG